VAVFSSGGAESAERWDVGHRIRDVEEGPDGSVNPGALIHVTRERRSGRSDRPRHDSRPVAATSGILFWRGRVRRVLREDGPDGSLWMLEHANPGALIDLTGHWQGGRSDGSAGTIPVRSRRLAVFSFQ